MILTRKVGEYEMGYLDHEISVYENNKTKFTSEYDQHWVIISRDNILGFFRTFEAASAKLIEEYDPKNPNRRFLVRKINEPTPVLNSFRHAL